MRYLLLPLVLIAQLGSFAQSSAPCAPNRLVLKFKSEFIPEASTRWKEGSFGMDRLDELRQLAPIQAVRDLGGRGLGGDLVLEFTTTEQHDVQDLVARYAATGLFEYVEPDYAGSGSGQAMPMDVTPDDTFFWRQYGLHNDGTFSNSPAVADADIDMPEAWEIEQGSADIIVAVLDSGMKLDHPEISGRIWENTDESTSGSDSDGNGYTDDLNGWDFVNGDADPTDDHGHGTNVTGILAANGNNATGYAGVDWNCMVMPLKILNSSNSGFYSWWTAAIYYAVDNGARVLNMSVGGSSFSNSMMNAVDYAHQNGATIVVSMMNFNNDANYYPAAYGNTIAVGSTDANDQRTEPFFWSSTSGSNYGTHIDVCAPGNFIYGLRHNSNTNYGTYWGGTSQSAPYVAGLASLLLAQDPGRTPADIRAIITETAEDQVGDPTEDTAGWDPYHGHGRINAHQALACFPECYSSVVSGCTDANACNFDSAATSDDGSCEFTSCLPACLADFNGSGTVDSGDLLALLGEYGCSENCAYDLDGDDTVGTADILMVVSLYGQVCLE